MNLQEYAAKDGLALAKLVRDKEISPRELVHLAVDGARKVNPEINAIIEVYEDVFDTIDEDLVANGIFGGVPFLRKDIGAEETGRLQEQGSRLLRGYVCDSDSNLWTRFKQSGLVNIGRSAVPEFAILGRTETALQGITRNPWNPDRTAGGSSGGAAAAVAAGIVPMAHASDGGGSTRIPASCCGTVGLLPSRGRISTGPKHEDPLLGFAREFIVSRSVRDTAAMLDAVHGYVPGDPYEIARPEQLYVDELGAPPGKLKIAISPGPWTNVAADPEVLDAVVHVGRTLEEMGHTVEERIPPVDFYKCLDMVTYAFAIFEAGTAKIAEDLNRPLDLDHVEPLTMSMIRLGQSVTSDKMLEIFETITEIRQTMGRFLAEYDLVLSPTLAQLPEEHAYFFDKPETSYEDMKAEDERFVQYCGLFNISGQPAISLPLAQSNDGLPIGIQFAAQFGREDLLLRVASALEEAMPWSGRRPPIHVGSD